MKRLGFGTKNSILSVTKNSSFWGKFTNSQASGVYFANQTNLSVKELFSTSKQSRWMHTFEDIYQHTCVFLSFSLFYFDFSWVKIVYNTHAFDIKKYTWCRARNVLVLLSPERTHQKPPWIPWISTISQWRLWYCMKRLGFGTKNSILPVTENSSFLRKFTNSQASCVYFAN